MSTISSLHGIEEPFYPTLALQSPVKGDLSPLPTLLLYP